MAGIEDTVDIECPVDKVFTYVEDAKSWPKWHLSMLDADHTSSGRVGVGTTFVGVNKVMGRRLPWTSKITEYEINKMWRENITSGEHDD